MNTPEFTSFARMQWTRPGWLARLRGKPIEPQIRIDGTDYVYRTGVWSFWVRKLQCKFLYSRAGRVHCRDPRTPDPAFLAQADPDAPDTTGRYTWGDWQRALGQCVIERVAELFIASHRLAQAGLGPEPGGIVLVRRARLHDGPAEAVFGLRIADAKRLPAREPVTEAEMLAAGVRPDGIRSCLRQQLNGYVTDLNSVIGAIPLEAEAETAAIAARIREAVTARDCGRQARRSS